jgi:hypothetical protein
MYLRGAALPAPTSWTLEDDLNRTYCDGGLSATPMLVATDRTGRLCVVNFVYSMRSQEKALQETLLAAAVVQAQLSKPDWVATRVWARVFFTEKGRCLNMHAPIGEFGGLLNDAHAVMRLRGLKAAKVADVVRLLEKSGKLATFN